MVVFGIKELNGGGVMEVFQVLNANAFRVNGDRPAAINAASIGMVPDPQKGSNKGSSASHPDIINREAAQFSLRDALPCS